MYNIYIYYTYTSKLLKTISKCGCFCTCIFHKKYRYKPKKE